MFLHISSRKNSHVNEEAELSKLILEYGLWTKFSEELPERTGWRS